jgi:hypothetical protein
MALQGGQISDFQENWKNNTKWFGRTSQEIRRNGNNNASKTGVTFGDGSGG